MPATITPRQLVDALELLEDPRAWRKELRKTYRRVGNEAAKWSRAGMRSSGDRQLAGAAAAVRGTSNTTSASVNVYNTPRQPYALAAVMGTVDRTGWFADERFDGSDVSNNPPWIGTDWDPAVAGEGPRGINDPLAEHEGELLTMFEAATDEMFTKAFPRGALHR